MNLAIYIIMIKIIREKYYKVIINIKIMNLEIKWVVIELNLQMKEWKFKEKKITEIKMRLAFVDLKF